MKLILERNYFNDATIGVLRIEGKDNPIWFTIERPDLNNQNNISCIPEGTYKVAPYSSDKFPDVWEVKDVLNRTKILIHQANWAHDLEGCIGVGDSLCYIKYGAEYKKSVSNSKKTIQAIKNTIGYPSEFELVVRS